MKDMRTFMAITATNGVLAAGLLSYNQLPKGAQNTLRYGLAAAFGLSAAAAVCSITGVNPASAIPAIGEKAKEFKGAASKQVAKLTTAVKGRLPRR